MNKAIITLCALSVSTAGLAQTIPDRVAHGHKNVDQGFYREIQVPPIQQLGANADLVLEATITKTRAFLGPNKRHVLTDYLIHPVRTFMAKPTTERPTPGKTVLILRLRGGEMTIDGVPVRIKDDNLAPFQNGDRFLLFLKRLADGDARDDRNEEIFMPLGEIVGMFKLESGRARSMIVDGGFPKELEDLPVESLVSKALQPAR